MSNTELRNKIRQVLREVEVHRMAVVQAGIRGLEKDAQKAFLETKSTIARSGIDPESWAEQELVRIFEEGSAK